MTAIDASAITTTSASPAGEVLAGAATDAAAESLATSAGPAPRVEMASADEIRNARPALERLARDLERERFPKDIPSVQIRSRDVRVLVLERRRMLLIPFRITFAGYVNGNCQVAMHDPTIHKTTLVDLSIAAYSDECRSIRMLASVDLNMDGVPDFIYAASVHSNRYPVYLEEPRVYLSRDSGERFCYAPLASATLGPPYNAISALNDIRDAVSRIGPRAIACVHEPECTGTDCLTYTDDAGAQ